MVVFAILDPTTLLVGGVLVLCLLWWLSTRRPPGLPPGPGPALPLLGHLHLLPKDPRAQLWTWRRQYGDVVSLYLGGQLTVVLTSYSAIREALVTFADVFSDRPHVFLTDHITNHKGISTASGHTWREQRMTSLKILREMGLGTDGLAARVQEEITHYIRAIRQYQGAPVDLGRMTQVSISNNICSITWGKRSDYQDPEFVDYLQCMDQTFKLLAGTAVAHYMPFLRHIPGDPFKIHQVVANFDRLFAFIDQHIADHRRTMEEQTGEKGEDEEQQQQQHTDFIYSYLRRVQEHEIRGDTGTTLSAENLKMCVSDLFLAGTETTASALQWTLLFFLHHSRVQDRCFQEVNDVIGPDRRPAMSDRPHLPYLEATIWEVLRRADIVPLNLLHAPARDVTFRGYVIPKDAVVIPFLSSALHDPDIWGDPENFRPERFIGADGELTRTEELIPFGIGRRVCLGESLARMELFLYLTTLIQHFRFLPPEDGQLPSLEGTFGLTHMPQPFKIRAVPRM